MAELAAPQLRARQSSIGRSATQIAPGGKILNFGFVSKIHINEFVLDQDGLVDQQKIDLVSRMGGNWYCRSDKNSMFEVDKPIATVGIGVDALPDNIRLSKDLTGNDLGKIGSMQRIPSTNEQRELLSNYSGGRTLENAKNLLNSNNVTLAYAILNQLNQ